LSAQSLDLLSERYALEDAGDGPLDLVVGQRLDARRAVAAHIVGEPGGFLAWHAEPRNSRIAVVTADPAAYKSHANAARRTR
jgi:quercetin dioxygenase-like cupin family protein